MTVQDLIDKKKVKAINIGEEPEREITKVFCCDLLSIAMGRAPAGCAWVTVMANMNTLAVASLTDAACIILAEGAALDENCVKKAQIQGITVLSSELPIFDIALEVYKMIENKDS